VRCRTVGKSRPFQRKQLKGMKIAAKWGSEIMSRNFFASSDEKTFPKKFTAARSESLTEW
jgi:hypothetical protein